MVSRLPSCCSSSQLPVCVAEAGRRRGALSSGAHRRSHLLPSSADRQTTVWLVVNSGEFADVFTCSQSIKSVVDCGRPCDSSTDSQSFVQNFCL